MPAQSKAQRRLFALALQFKRGGLSASEVSDEVKELSKLPEKDLKDYAETKERDLPNKVDEDAVTVNPNMNVQGMGAVELSGNPGSMNSFTSQAFGSGDLPENPNKNKKVKLLSFDKFLDLMKVNK
jgi:hypothetical protein